MQERSWNRFFALESEARKSKAATELCRRMQRLTFALLLGAVLYVLWPAMYQVSESVEAGGFVTYGVSTADLWRRAATYVDKILKGTRPADLPVEQPTKFELVINLTTAKQIGLTIPPNVLARADRVLR